MLVTKIAWPANTENISHWSFKDKFVTLYSNMFQVTFIYVRKGMDKV
jgi:hypothetical protein